MSVVRYVGGHEAVEVPLPSGALALVKNGETLETTGDHAAGLLEQTLNWQPVKAASPKPASKSADTPPGEKG